MSSSDTDSRVREERACRLCGTALTPVADLGAHYVSDFPAQPWTEEVPVPLKLARCENPECWLVQLTHTVPRDRLYRRYWYRSGLQPAMVQALQDLALWGRKKVSLQAGDYVVDIGANDGTLLQQFALSSVNRVAFDPAMNLHEGLRENCEILVPDYFPAQQYDAPQAKLVFSVAMFYDLPDPRGFVQEVKRILHPQGVWVLQFGDLRALLQQNAFDAICHEHLEYYSFPVVENLLEQEGLRVVDAERNLVNGGSLRLAVGHSHQWPRDAARARIAKIRAEDRELDTKENWRDWAGRIEAIRDEVREQVYEAWDQGGPVDLLGASIKGNTLLQYFQIGPGYAREHLGPDVRQAIERAPEKVGRYTVGSWVPIVGEADTRRTERARLMLVLPWHFREALIRRERVTSAGAELLFPLPLPETVRL